MLQVSVSIFLELKMTGSLSRTLHSSLVTNLFYLGFASLCEGNLICMWGLLQLPARWQGMALDSYSCQSDSCSQTHTARWLLIALFQPSPAVSLSRKMVSGNSYRISASSRLSVSACKLMGCNYLVSSALLLQGTNKHLRGLTLHMWKSDSQTYLQGAINFKRPWHHAKHYFWWQWKAKKEKPTKSVFHLFCPRLNQGFPTSSLLTVGAGWFFVAGSGGGGVPCIVLLGLLLYI